ncbi:peptide-methionine (S)-S-oxide reductase MsrA [Sulfuriferula thiophila]|uniref:peptide-methionine (S)-S-oxide reductase MsrA n=1 Tax=Sulfuriferula thiophila TaxID=1781211 RepID=UPI001673A793|nr:peptide-methionine (S)-S-oxide reductase MsrA [Sulfuriferula thiophila]
MFQRHSHPLLHKFAILGCAALLLSGSAMADGQLRSLPDPLQDLTSSTGQQTAVLAGGCFWGIDAVFKHVKGVTSTTSGYAGGQANSASYYQVSRGTTGHAEAVRVVFDPKQISYGQLLKIYFSVAHNPTELNYQGPDHGTQYRSAIFYSNDAQRQVAQAYIKQLQSMKLYPAPIVTQVAALAAFYPAEDYHQNYLALHPDQPYIVANDLPKLEHLRQEFPGVYQ